MEAELLIQRFALFIKKSDCGANSKGGHGFQPGNTCASGRFENAEFSHYTEVRKRNADVRIPRDGETADDAEMYRWREGGDHDIRRKKYFDRDNVHLVDIPVEYLSVSTRDIDPKRQERLKQGSEFVDDPIIVHADGMNSKDDNRIHFTIDDGNNRAHKAMLDGKKTIPAFLHMDADQVEDVRKILDGDTTRLHYGGYSQVKLESMIDKWVVENGGDPALKWTRAKGIQKLPPQETMDAIAEEQQSYAGKPIDDETKKSYDSFKTALYSQFEAIQKSGLQVYAWEGEGEPYKESPEKPWSPNSNTMRRRVEEEKKFFFFMTQNGFGAEGAGESAKHPLLEMSPYKTTDGKPMLANDVFRVVHDSVGHLYGKFSFSTQGEMNAMLAHASTLPREAHGALWAETFGQNAVYEKTKKYADQNTYVSKFLPEIDRMLKSPQLTSVTTKSYSADIQTDPDSDYPLGFGRIKRRPAGWDGVNELDDMYKAFFARASDCGANAEGGHGFQPGNSCGGEGDGGGSAPADRDSRLSAMERFGEKLKGKLTGDSAARDKVLSLGNYINMTPKQKESHKKVLADAMKQMPPKMVAAFSAGISEMTYYGDKDSLQESASAINGTQTSAGVFGFYRPGSKSMHLDGAPESIPDEHKATVQRGIYIHEMAHAADFSDHTNVFSKSQEWVTAHTEEIVAPDTDGSARLTNYANTNPSEGFAEFMRIFTEHPEDTRKRFPKSVAAVESRYGRM